MKILAMIKTEQKNNGGNDRSPGLWTESGMVHPPESISDQIYDLLKKKILNSEIQPGERLMQEEVAEAFKASRTPVRQAFRLLEKDGLVERLPQGGLRITRLDVETINDLFAIRAVLETYGVQLACDRIQPETIKTLRSIKEQADQLLESASIQRETKIRQLFELNSFFHETIYRSTKSGYLLGLISNLRNTVLRLRALGLRKDNTWRQSWDEHGQLIDCLERKDKKTAGKLMRRHVASAMSNALSQWNLGEKKHPRKDRSAAIPKEINGAGKRKKNTFHGGGLNRGGKHV
jgi:DNA-binding GntR family transcriptional regulator